MMMALSLSLSRYQRDGSWEGELFGLLIRLSRLYKFGGVSVRKLRPNNEPPRTMEREGVGVEPPPAR